MMFDTENKIVQLCAQGMKCEGEGRTEAANELFRLAWKKADSDLEKFIAAHYVARHQSTVKDKLGWDIISLDFALKLEGAKPSYPSLYLNVARGYEDIGENDQALKHYNLGLSFVDSLLADGYGKMIRGALEDGLQRIKTDDNL